MSPHTPARWPTAYLKPLAALILGLTCASTAFGQQLPPCPANTELCVNGVAIARTGGARPLYALGTAGSQAEVPAGEIIETNQRQRVIQLAAPGGANGINLTINGTVRGLDGTARRVWPIIVFNGTEENPNIITINASGAVESQDINPQSHAIYLSSPHNVVNLNGGAISTVSEQGFGVYARGASSTVNMTGGSIETGGVRGHGIFVNDADTVIDISGGAISTDGELGFGIVGGANADNLRIEISGEDTIIRGKGRLAPAIVSQAAGTQITMKGGSIITEGTGGIGIYASGAEAVITMEGGSISTQSEGISAFGILAAGADAQITMTGGSISTKGDGNGGISSTDSNVIITMTGGSISTEGDNAPAIGAGGANPQITLGNEDAAPGAESAVTLTAAGKGSDGVRLVARARAEGNAPRLTTYGDSLIRATGEDGVGVRTRLVDPDALTPTAPIALDLRGDIEATGTNAVGLLLENTTGGVSTLTVSGRIMAKEGATTAIQDATGLGTTLTVQSGGAIAGAVDLGAGEDTLILNDGAGLSGAVDLGEGEDTFDLKTGGTFAGALDGGMGADRFTLSAEVNGVIRGGADNDVFTVTPTGMVLNDLDGGAGQDTFNVNGVVEGDLLGGAEDDTFNVNVGSTLTGDIDGGDGSDTITVNAPLTGDLTLGPGDDMVILQDSAQLTGDIDLGDGDDEFVLTSRTARLAGVIDGGEGADTLDYQAAFAGAGASTLISYRNLETVAGEADSLAGLLVIKQCSGGGAVPPGTPCPAGETASYAAPPAIGAFPPDTVSTADPRAGLTTLFYVDPTGPATQASTLGALSTAIVNVLNQRQAGGSPASRNPQRSARPVQVAANVRLPGLLGAARRPILWGEVFGGERRRGTEGRVLGYAQDYVGVVFGLEQDYANAHRFGLLAGYAEAHVATHTTSLKAETHSVFGGAYGRFAVNGLTIESAVNLGHEWHENRRFIFSGTRATAQADYTGVFVSPSLTLRYDRAVNANFLLRPAVQATYTHGWYRGYREQGGMIGDQDFNLRVDRRRVSHLSLRGQLAGVWTVSDQGALGLRAGVEGRFLDSSAFSGSLSGSRFRLPNSADETYTNAYVGLEGRYALAEQWSLRADVEVSHNLGGVSERTLSGLLRLEYAY